MNVPVKKLQFLLEHDNHQERQALKDMLASDPLFRPKFGLSLTEERRIALERLKRICDGKHISVFDFIKNPLRISAGLNEQVKSVYIWF